MFLPENIIGLFDFMYSTLTLKAGESLDIQAFFPETSLKSLVTITVHPEQEVIEIGDKSYKVFVCDVPFLNETDYVTEDGTLVKIEMASDTPSERVTIELAE